MTKLAIYGIIPRMDYVQWIRQRVGRRKIFLAFGTVILRDGYGRILLQKRADFDFWGLPGGALELGEDIESCARRELAEETGLRAGGLALTGVYTHPRFDVTYPNGDEVQQFTFCFNGRWQGGQMAVDGVETSRQGFFAPEALPDLELPSWYRAMLADYLRGGAPAFTPPFVNGQARDQIREVRPYIGTAPYIGVGATAAVVRDDGRILMIRRRDNGAWFFPAGYADLGENAAHTAVREVREETGYHIQPERILGVYSGPMFRHTFPNGDQVKNVGVLFRARLLGGRPSPQEAEVSELAWMTPQEVVAIAPPAYRDYFVTAVHHLAAGAFIM
ncbi:MAG TPA: NUDIX domain-containing protein [Anaerolineae bacterium]|nr:NUDIX domain-containing protein [Anaerolineae bacterium]